VLQLFLGSEADDGTVRVSQVRMTFQLEKVRVTGRIECEVRMIGQDDLFPLTFLIEFLASSSAVIERPKEKKKKKKTLAGRLLR
jgi:hypothetical protein